jgi:hypothetical protein
MTGQAWAEMQTAIGGALRLACGDRQAIGVFDATVDGFWRSFRAALICYPLYLVLIAMRVTPAQCHMAGMPRVFVIETIGYVIAWTAFPLLVLQLARMFDRQPRFLRFMVAYNWSQIPQIALMTIVVIDRMSGVFPPAAGQVAELAATVAVLVYEWYIARLALAVSGAQAAFVVILDLLLGTVLNRIAVTLYQPGLLFG